MLLFRNFRVLTVLSCKSKTCTQGSLKTRDLRTVARQTPPIHSAFTDDTALALQDKQSSKDRLENEHKPNSRLLPEDLIKDYKLSLTDSQTEVVAPTYNLAAYVNKSTTLQKFVQLGVDLHHIERRKGLADFVLRLDFDTNVQPHLLFLQDSGVPAEAFGEFITKNPLIFKVDLDDLQTRINYLEAKKFTPSQRRRIVSRNPFWLMFSTNRIDRRLGHFQQQYQLSGDDVRFLASKQPRLITYNIEHIRKSEFCIREEMGFDADETKCLLLSKPRLWMMNSDVLIERFAYVHQEMKLSHQMLLEFPEVLCSREFRLRERHEFLKLLGRAQYDPQKELYVSPKAVVEGTNYHFVKEVAKSNIETYNLFLKSR